MLILGIQFLLWAIGGLYFSWTNIDEIRGDTLKNEKPFLVADANYVSPAIFLPQQLKPSDSLVSLQLTSILEKPCYEMVYISQGDKKVKLINALNGEIRKPLNVK